MKRSKSIVAVLALSLIFLGTSGTFAHAAGSGAQLKKQVRQHKQIRSMKKSGTAAGTASGTTLGTQQRLQQRIQDPSTH